MKLRRPVLLFDSDCAICRAQVKWLIERDRSARLRFAPLQSPVGRSLLRKHGLSTGYRRSLALIEGEKLRLRSDAALRSCAYLDSRWRRLASLRAVPRLLRDLAYRALMMDTPLAPRRARETGRRWTPPPEFRARFLGAPFAEERRRSRRRRDRL